MLQDKRVPVPRGSHRAVTSPAVPRFPHKLREVRIGNAESPHPSRGEGSFWICGWKLHFKALIMQQNSSFFSTRLMGTADLPSLGTAHLTPEDLSDLQLFSLTCLCGRLATQSHALLFVVQPHTLLVCSAGPVPSLPARPSSLTHKPWVMSWCTSTFLGSHPTPPGT